MIAPQSRESNDDCHIRCLAVTDRWVGAYALHLRFQRRSLVRIGQYNHGKPIELDEGHYVYIGSAMGSGRGLHLPKRLIRHATRSNVRMPHPVHDLLIRHFMAFGLGRDRLSTRSPKRLHWNIDYVLDDNDAELVDIFYVRNERRLEHDLVRILERLPATVAPFPGLGAHDHPGHSHFFCLTSGARTWSTVCGALHKSIGQPT